MRYYLTDEAVKSGITFATPREGDAGYDIRSLLSYAVEPGQQVMISTGLHLAIPDGWVGLVRDRSSMAAKRLYTHGGVIDSSYRGEVRILMSNQSPDTVNILSREKVAQLVIVQHARVEVAQVKDRVALGETSRGEKGFGSTGALV